jgi:anti-sigma B factor antagonist
MRNGTNGDDPDGERRQVFEVPTGPEGRRVFRVLRALDLATSDAVESALCSALDEGAGVRLDLSEVTFLDSSGMRGMLRAFRLAQERNVVFEVVPGPPAVQRVLHITGVDARLTFVDGDDPRA